MKIFVMVDMEGISGITHRKQVIPGEVCYDEGRQYMTWDINACVAGCFEGGATEVIVRDAHYKGSNCIWDQLDGRARYIIGSSGPSGNSRMPGIEDCDGLILLGYHAMAGTPAAVLEHTMSSIGWQNFWVNGALAGEIHMDTGYAAHFGVPVIMVSGDDKACAEARALLPGIETAEVKQSHSLFGATLLSKPAAHALLRETTAAAVKRCKEIEPLATTCPTVMRLEQTERSAAINNRNKPWMTVIDGRTAEVTGDTFYDAFFRVLEV